MKTIEIVIVEDHTLFRKGLISTLKNYPEIKVIGEVGNGLDLMTLLINKKPDLILMDLEMSDMDGIETAEQVRSKYPCIKIVVLSMYQEEAFIMDMIQLGVSGVLSKNAEPEEMVATLREVGTKGACFDNTVTDLMIKDLRNKNRTSFDNTMVFSEKELKILRFICKEYKTEEIARELNLSARTIEGYRKRLLEKSGSKNVAGLVVYTMKNSLVNLL